jgi:hypothetical protein
MTLSPCLIPKRSNLDKFLDTARTQKLFVMLKTSK